jgi:type I restriction enzyme, S subunit
MKQTEEMSLPKGWELVRLDSVIKTFIVPQRDRPKTFDGNIPWCRIEDIDGIYLSKSKIGLCVSKEVVESMPLRVYPKGTVIVSCSADLGRCAIIATPLITNQTFIGLVPSEKIDSLYLYYLMGSKSKMLNNLATGATIKYLSKNKFQELEIPIPSLKEQQRIVSILDKAFAALAIAKANAEQNLKNAKELFESYLQGVFENKGEDWEEQVLEDCFKMKSGDNLTAKNMIEGSYPVFGGNGIAGYHNKYNLSGSNVIIGRVGALCGNVRHINENIWLTDNAFKLVDLNFDFDQSFLTYLLNYKDLRSYARQAAQPVISNSSLKDVVLNFPKTKEEQQKIVRQLDALKAETKKLEAIYHQKINDLEELKKSVLQKAFSGELETKKHY